MNITQLDLPIPLSDIESVLAWVDTFKLSRPTKKINRDFSDAVLLAEILNVHYPKLVEMHNYPPRNSHSLKLNNWMTLNRKVLKKLKLGLCGSNMEQLANSAPGVIERLLVMVREKIRRDEEANRVSKDETNNMSSGGSYYEACGDDEHVLVVPVKTRVNGVLEIIQQKVVAYDAFLTLKEELKDARDAADVLKQKVEHLDTLMKLKDQRIDELQSQLERKQARRRELEVQQNAYTIPHDNINSTANINDFILNSNLTEPVNKDIKHDLKMSNEESKIEIVEQVQNLEELNRYSEEFKKNSEQKKNTEELRRSSNDSKTTLNDIRQRVENSNSKTKIVEPKIRLEDYIHMGHDESLTKLSDSKTRIDKRRSEPRHVDSKTKFEEARIKNSDSKTRFEESRIPIPKDSNRSFHKSYSSEINNVVLLVENESSENKIKTDIKKNTEVKKVHSNIYKEVEIKRVSSELFKDSGAKKSASDLFQETDIKKVSSDLFKEDSMKTASSDVFKEIEVQRTTSDIYNFDDRESSDFDVFKDSEPNLITIEDTIQNEVNEIIKPIDYEREIMNYTLD